MKAIVYTGSKSNLQFKSYVYSEPRPDKPYRKAVLFVGDQNSCEKKLLEWAHLELDEELFEDQFYGVGYSVAGHEYSIVDVESEAFDHPKLPEVIERKF